LNFSLSNEKEKIKHKFFKDVLLKLIPSSTIYVLALFKDKSLSDRFIITKTHFKKLQANSYKTHVIVLKHFLTHFLRFIPVFLYIQQHW